jgi:hypothetical protein
VWEKTSNRPHFLPFSLFREIKILSETDRADAQRNETAGLRPGLIKQDRSENIISSSHFSSSGVRTLSSFLPYYLRFIFPRKKLGT